MNRTTFILAFAVASLDAQNSFAANAKPLPVQPIPDTVRVERDVTYLAKDRKELADIYTPKTIAPGARLPAVVIIHGGGFNDGDKAKSREVNYGVTVALNGYVGMSINYKLRKISGQVTWPQNLHDCKTAVRWPKRL